MIESKLITKRWYEAVLHNNLPEWHSMVYLLAQLLKTAEYHAPGGEKTEQLRRMHADAIDNMRALQPVRDEEAA